MKKMSVQELACSVSHALNQTIPLAPGKSHHPMSLLYGTNRTSRLKNSNLSQIVTKQGRFHMTNSY